MTERSHAVFLSYASQDAQAAQRIADALRAAGIDVWFDQSELRGGDAWDRKIRQQIHDCTLFMPVISANTAARHEGYFRLEWDLADQRTHMIAHNRAFIVPVCVDGTSESSADTPESYRRVHWTRLLGGETSPAFVERLQRLLSGEIATAIRQPASAQPGVVGALAALVPAARSPKRGLLVALAVVLLGAVAYFAIGKLWISKPEVVSSPTVTASAAAADFRPPPHSIAVLPFVNMSGDKEQEYFSDGLTEELLNSLARINELQVSARTSSFSFKGKDADISTIAHKLNVASVLEGSVRRSGNTIRVTAQLNNAVTGFHLWSQTYDRDLSNVLQLQTEIATAVATALKLTLLADTAAKIEIGGTHNPEAFDAYLRASKTWDMQHGRQEMEAAIASYDEAIRLDPAYAIALADRVLALTTYAGNVTGQDRHDALDKAHADARKAIEIAPNLAESHLALASVLKASFDFGGAAKEYQRALALNPGNARLLRIYGLFATEMGWTEAGLAAGRRGVALDPLSRNQHRNLGDALYDARRYEESTAAYRGALTVDPDDSSNNIGIGINYFLLGDLQSAASWCEAKPTNDFSSACLAVVYDKLGRRADAQAALEKFRTSFGEIYPYALAQVYASWGNAARALECLEKAIRLRDPALPALKVEPFFDPLRQEPRFQAIERALKFPD